MRGQVVQLKRDDYAFLEELANEAYGRVNAAMAALKGADFGNCECKYNVDGPIIVLRDTERGLRELIERLHDHTDNNEDGAA
jgi:hypothetical protein